MYLNALNHKEIIGHRRPYSEFLFIKFLNNLTEIFAILKISFHHLIHVFSLKLKNFLSFDVDV